MTSKHANPGVCAESIPIFIAHYNKLDTRLARLQKMLEEQGFNNIAVNAKFPRESLGPKEFALAAPNCTAYMTGPLRIPGVYDPAVARFSLLNPANGDAHLGNFLNHIDIWKQISNGEADYAIILEDDAVPSNECMKELQELVKHMPSDLDIAYLNDGCGQTVQSLGLSISPGTLWYKVPRYKSRTTCAYIMSKKCAQTIVQGQLFPVSMPIDWELIFIAARHNLGVYWSLTHPFTEGTKNGDYNSSVQR